ncbi:ABC transporter substrate-binding protein [Conexibacter sp. JD483]|uniref:ABC transporter substrate-binding protein n=1 Tax=unclassified Conexibacter TaxID=2627773 RepID=UPI002726D452|nr:MULTISPECIES: ABC transporter substrate-binding protein [unclassified Conexibacter]MDO8185363.1 ABC transporter substrate-binding protein [Conexibacter sp. CPCC 205706]MDO8198461.1 ABC transporter substrate-binding protein [Conexibacter sp. CPCC 205762]MDR9368774.1 ABC transporter substrate-binding protein [Conexibacter sp. JD483]
MTRTSVRAVLLSLLALVAAVAVGCGSSDDDSSSASTSGGSGSDKKVVLRVGTQKDGIRAVLQKSGQLDDLPYEIEWSTFVAGPPLVEAAGADRIDVAWVGCAPPIFGAAAGASFNVIAAVKERDSQENRLLVPKDSSITSIADLKGKKIAVPRGTSGHAFILNALKSEGLSSKDVEFAFLAPPDALAAFQSGSVDALSVWDPFATQAIATLDAKEIAAGEPYEHGLGFEIASSAQLRDPAKVAAIQDYLRRLQAAWTWAGDNPDEWAAAWSEDSGLPLEVTRIAARRKASDIVPLDGEIVDSQQRLADLFFSEGELTRRVTFTDIVDESVYGDRAAN